MVGGARGRACEYGERRPLLSRSGPDAAVGVDITRDRPWLLEVADDDVAAGRQDLFPFVVEIHPDDRWVGCTAFPPSFEGADAFTDLRRCIAARSDEILASSQYSDEEQCDADATLRKDELTHWTPPPIFARTR